MNDMNSETKAKMDRMAHALQRVEGWWPQLRDPKRYCPVHRQELRAALEMAGYEVPSRREKRRVEMIQSTGYDVPA